MERAISVEEKIRRAEEIYAKRRQGNNTQIATVKLDNKNNKKDIKLLKKMIMQILICMAIYFAIYTIHKNDYVFSNDFTNKLNEILSYDINFNEFYNKIKDKIQERDVEQKENNQDTNEAIGGAEQTEQTDNLEEQEEKNKSQLSEAEQDIVNIKNTTTFIKPIEGVITSKYGLREPTTSTVPKNHTGTDIAANIGIKIKSATDGEVVLASEEGDYGKHLKIQIGEVSIIYAHCNNLYVKQGDKVKQGQEIAEVGTTGNSTGPHLHFEVRISERTVDPQNILEL